MSHSAAPETRSLLRGEENKASRLVIIRSSVQRSIGFDISKTGLGGNTAQLCRRVQSVRQCVVCSLCAIDTDPPCFNPTPVLREHSIFEEKHTAFFSPVTGAELRRKYFLSKHIQHQLPIRTQRLAHVFHCPDVIHLVTEIPKRGKQIYYQVELVGLSKSSHIIDDECHRAETLSTAVTVKPLRANSRE